MSADGSHSAPGATLRIGVLSTVQSLDPLQAQDFVSAMVVAQIFDTPYSRPLPDQDAQPLLFSGPLEPSEGGAVLSAAVRPDVFFSDGTRLTAEHVQKSLAAAAPLREHADVEVDGDRVLFRVSRPNARFDLVLTQAFASVTLEKEGRLLGTGPYMPAPGSTAEKMRLVRNPFRQPAAKLEALLFACYPPEDGEPRALVRAIADGEVDFTNVLQRKDVTSLQKVRKYFELGNSTAMLYFNTERSSLSDGRVRRAMAYAINRLDLASVSHDNALAHVASNILPPMMTRWKDGIIPNLDKARALYAEAGGVPGRLRMLLMFGPRPYLPHPRPTAEHVVEQLGKLGVEVDIEQARDSQDYYQRIAAGDYDLALTGWIADTVDPVDFLEAVLSEEAIPSPDRPISIHANLARYRNPEVDRLLERLRREADEDIQRQLLEMAAQEIPVLPLMYGSITFVHSWDVRNFTPPLLGIPDFSGLEIRSFGR